MMNKMIIGNLFPAAAVTYQHCCDRTGGNADPADRGLCGHVERLKARQKRGSVDVVVMPPGSAYIVTDAPMSSRPRCAREAAARFVSPS
jgi:hypothetical protein